MIVRRLEGLDPTVKDKAEKFTVEIRWKGPKLALSSLRRSAVKRNFTKEVESQNGDVVEWDEEFQSVCTLSAYKDNVFHPWEISFTVFNVSFFFFLSLCKVCIFFVCFC